ncbi:MAG: DUF4230 domain-containing protein [Cytophagales bacterium]|jgi:hypothetical protein|nr:DUF4230 domain-containing protein [Cytophagales bacterium]MCE2895854.1 DUF4230 domain-containing protein [Flammeovirgaceae bacterium]MCA6369008.1 DUF4230 domain-containing protein [Cytophagales bacterium]MCA6371482.1 DUF4230 domain-containing protein [Cytophagales bacterium]MCA6377831.1 DUF4230 domain-containing protein [Cytophagales bacterium]
MKSVANLAVQIILVVAGVLVFSFFDPFGLLAPKKKTLQDTPISVVSIKEIGQLITAEYYGEVLSSLQEELIEDVVENQVEFENQVGTLNQKYLKALEVFHSNRDTIKVRWYRKRKDLIEAFYIVNQSLVNDILYQKMVSIVLTTKKIDSEGDLLKAIWSEKEKIDFTKEYALDATILKKQATDELKKLKETKAFKKKQIIAIGRGWVKAGIDFGSFNERNFKYDKANRTIYLFGVEPQILTCDINPWFNAKQKIKGFEIIAATNKANDSSYLRKVKQSCLDKLRTQAEKAGITKQAKINAEETLKHFFSLLLNEPLDKVVIMKNSLAEYQKLLDCKGIYPKEKLPLIDSTLLALYKIDSMAAGQAVTKLLGSKTVLGNDTCFINRFSALTYHMVEDKLITADELKLLSKAFQDTTYSHLDSIWYLPLPAKIKINEQSKLWAAKNAKYNTKGIGHWYDSVTNKPGYACYKIKADSLNKTLSKTEMITNRATALSETLKLLKKNCKTVVIAKAEENDTIKIETFLNSLNK